MNDSSLTVEQVRSTPRYRFCADDVPESDSAYILARDPLTWADHLIFGMKPAFCHEDATIELVRRANLCPTVEAQLAEAVELLERVAVLLDGEEFGENGFDLRCDTVDFLAKVKP